MFLCVVACPLNIICRNLHLIKVNQLEYVLSWSNNFLPHYPGSYFCHRGRILFYSFTLMVSNEVGDVIIHFISLRLLMGNAMTWWFGYRLHSVTLLQHVRLPSLFNVRTYLATLASLLERYIWCNQNSCTNTVLPVSQRCPCDSFFQFAIFYLFCITQTPFFSTDLFALFLSNSNITCIDALKEKRRRISHFKVAVMQYMLYVGFCGLTTW